MFKETCPDEVDKMMILLSKEKILESLGMGHPLSTYDGNFQSTALRLLSNAFRGGWAADAISPSSVLQPTRRLERARICVCFSKLSLVKDPFPTWKGCLDSNTS